MSKERRDGIGTHGGVVSDLEDELARAVRGLTPFDAVPRLGQWMVLSSDIRNQVGAEVVWAGGIGGAWWEGKRTVVGDFS